MKRTRFIALILAVVLMFTGCTFAQEYNRVAGMLLGNSDVHYQDMEYSRPDMAEIQQTLLDACTAAEGQDLDTILEGIYAFYDDYDWFYTCYSLADIRYCSDLTDVYWEGEYSFCMENSASVDAMLEELYYALAASPCRAELEDEKYFGPGYFDSYEGENLWDETFTALLESEAALQNEYYALAAQALDYESGTQRYYDACAEDMASLLAELIAVRQEMAAYWGYADYVSFANDFYYYRDYTPSEMENYLSEIRQELVELYRQLDASDLWDGAYTYCTEQQTLAYVRTAAKNMGGTVWEAFQRMENGGLYDISYGANKYNSSFEVYLTSYDSPFVFMNPGRVRYDCLTLAHEFGHFCNDYASWGSYLGVDVLEVFSQGMEYLSLCYGEDTEELTRAKLADSLCTYVEQAAFADFELRMYALTEEDLTAEGLYRLYEEIARDYGFDSVSYDCREFVEITHFYTNPMYVFGYVVSNDAAMQLYQLEQEQAGAGLALLEENLDSQMVYFLEFLDSAGLESPFTEGRIQEVRQTFEEILG